MGLTWCLAQGERLTLANVCKSPAESGLIAQDESTRGLKTVSRGIGRVNAYWVVQTKVSEGSRGEERDDEGSEHVGSPRCCL